MATKKKPTKARPKRRRPPAKKAGKKKVTASQRLTNQLSKTLTAIIAPFGHRLEAIEDRFKDKIPAATAKRDEAGNVNELATTLADRSETVGNRIRSLCHRLGVSFPGCDAPNGCERTSAIAGPTLRGALTQVSVNLDTCGVLLDALEKNT